MKILVTGATGFTGKRVLPLLKAKADLRIFCRKESDTASAENLGCELSYGELGSLSNFEEALNGCEGLINIAPLTIGSIEKILAAAEESGIQRALFISSTRVFTRFASRSKTLHLDAEDKIQKSKINWTILRPTMIYGGAGDRTITKLLHFLKYSPFIPIPGNGKTLFQPIWVEDLSRAVVDAFFSKETIGKIYNLGGPRPLSLIELIDLACRGLRLKRFRINIPLPFLRTVIRLYESLSPHPFIREEQLLRLAEDKSCDYGEARRDFDFNPNEYSYVIEKILAGPGLSS